MSKKIAYGLLLLWGSCMVVQLFINPLLGNDLLVECSIDLEEYFEVKDEVETFFGVAYSSLVKKICLKKQSNKSSLVCMFNKGILQKFFIPHLKRAANSPCFF